MGEEDCTELLPQRSASSVVLSGWNEMDADSGMLNVTMLSVPVVAVERSLSKSMTSSLNEPSSVTFGLASLTSGDALDVSVSFPFRTQFSPLKIDTACQYRFQAHWPARWKGRSGFLSVAGFRRLIAWRHEPRRWRSVIGLLLFSSSFVLHTVSFVMD